MLQDGVGSQGMGAVPRVGSRNHTEMPLGKSLARCLWHSPWAAQVEGGVFSWLRGAACVGAQHGSSGIGSIQGQVGPCPREHLEGGSSQSWQCPVHTESPMAMWDAVGVNGARGAPAGENQAGLWVQQLAGHRGTLGRGGPCRQCSCRWHQIRAVTVAWTWVEAAAVT